MGAGPDSGDDDGTRTAHVGSGRDGAHQSSHGTAAPAVTTGRPAVEAVAAAPAVVAAVCSALLADNTGEQRAARLGALRDDVLDDDGRGDGAENNPERDDDQPDHVLQRVKAGAGINRQERLVGHEIKNALRHQRGDGPAERPHQHAEEIQQVTAADMFQRRDERHEADEQRRQRVAEVEDDFLEDVGPENHQRGELADEPQDGGDNQFHGYLI